MNSIIGKTLKSFIRNLRLTLIITILVSCIYPLSVTGISYLLFRDKAEGSLLKDNNKIVGSFVVGSQFVGDQWFHSNIANGEELNIDIKYAHKQITRIMHARNINNKNIIISLIEKYKRYDFIELQYKVNILNLNLALKHFE